MLHITASPEPPQSPHEFSRSVNRRTAKTSIFICEVFYLSPANTRTANYLIDEILVNKGVIALKINRQKEDLKKRAAVRSSTLQQTHTRNFSPGLCRSSKLIP
ncbi:hypothetical protein P9654_19885 [Bacillus atrophaeus]|uniref:hypothetical protein n=1 Tax=Bacillus atrophaeus TaxID=1452 RepID=UPI002E235FCD|nr:hypothetical protein [Bacillus atrophaeus]